MHSSINRIKKNLFQVSRTSYITGDPHTAFNLCNNFNLYRNKFFCALVIFLFELPTAVFAGEFKSVVNLTDSNVIPVEFRRITPNNFHIDDNVLTIHVNKSASFLLIPFKAVTKIKNVSFEWKKTGNINIQNAGHEETREGDDAYLRVGLILEGKPSLMNPLTPKWVRKVKDALHYPSDKMIYLVPGSQHSAGQRWTSPYSDEVEIIAVSSQEKLDGWNISEYSLQSSQPTVGLWLMADGDNTRSTFTSMLKQLTFH